MHRTNPDSLRSCLCFRVFRLNFASDFFNLLLMRFHQAEIIAVNHLIQGCNNEAWVVLNHQPCDHGRRKNDAPNHSTTRDKTTPPRKIKLRFIIALPIHYCIKNEMRKRIQ